MKYRTYQSTILMILAAVSVTLTACATTEKNREPASEDSQAIDGREPGSARGKFTWLDQVEDDFGRISAETSDRSVASDQQKDVLLKQKNWSFYYHPKTNHFYITLKGQSYKMIQTSLGDGDSFAFAAEGQAENPVTLSVLRDTEGRKVASEGPNCAAEVAYWDDSKHNYVKDNLAAQGKNCERLLKKLKEYIP